MHGKSAGGWLNGHRGSGLHASIAGCAAPFRRPHTDHRQVADDDVYFVANASPRSGWIDCRFRVSGKTPELWHPDTGHHELAALFAQDGPVTRVPLFFEPAGSVFVVFRKSPDASPPLAALLAPKLASRITCTQLSATSNWVVRSARFLPKPSISFAVAR